jgi:hypothetical protein
MYQGAISVSVASIIMSRARKYSYQRLREGTLSDLGSVGINGVDYRLYSGGFAAGLGNVERVEVLPFHQMGRYRWKELGMDYELQDVEPPSEEAVERTCDQFRAVGLRAD